MSCTFDLHNEECSFNAENSLAIFDETTGNKKTFIGDHTIGS